MKHLRSSITILLVGLVVFFNVERLNFATTDTINLASFVYVLGFLAVFSTIMIPRLWRAPIALPLLFWLGVYLLSKLFLFSDRPLVGGIYTYLTITEVTLISLLIWSAHNLARGLHDFEEAVASIALAPAGRRIHSLNKAEETIKNEMARSRRYQRPLTVVVVQPEPKSIQAALHRTVQEVQQLIMSRYVFTNLAQLISNQMERTNLVLEQHERSRFIILCPETKASETAEMIERIRTLANEKLGVSVHCGAASFPDEALTFEELVLHAEGHLGQAVNGSKSFSSLISIDTKQHSSSLST